MQDGAILEKPRDESEARSMIAKYNERSPATTVGSIRVTRVATGAAAESVSLAHVYISPLPPDVVNDLIRDGDVFYAAGGLLIESPRVGPFVLKVEGTMDSVQGLAVEQLVSNLFQVAS